MSRPRGIIAQANVGVGVSGIQAQAKRHGRPIMGQPTGETEHSSAHSGSRCGRVG